MMPTKLSKCSSSQAIKEFWTRKNKWFKGKARLILGQAMKPFRNAGFHWTKRGLSRKRGTWSCSEAKSTKGHHLCYWTRSKTWPMKNSRLCLQCLTSGRGSLTERGKRQWAKDFLILFQLVTCPNNKSPRSKLHRTELGTGNSTTGLTRAWWTTLWYRATIPTPITSGIWIGRAW